MITEEDYTDYSEEYSTFPLSIQQVYNLEDAIFSKQFLHYALDLLEDTSYAAYRKAISDFSKAKYKEQFESLIVQHMEKTERIVEALSYNKAYIKELSNRAKEFDIHIRMDAIKRKNNGKPSVFHRREKKWVMPATQVKSPYLVHP